ncbi:hypothetical protein [Arthrobacter sp. zg-Y1110]|uniref:hypothetical protein n=1 Tax=Arthrobacter sp. zg-Y1110 TaxID=2886932 RepID=UPI001D151863|nr:hypothetical protein [Arthrobacter sp. zg-Y1110]MCC3292955.1 hypothetical protein [Arthrobacter sp. zg-Y1110]UWX86894.1 hypothetical protein N2K99_18800 [Arthrobacter sp. zg-Y1110]
METATAPQNRFDVHQDSLTAAASLTLALAEADRWTSPKLAEAWAAENGFTAETVHDPFRFDELHRPGALVVQAGNVEIALRTVDSFHETVTLQGRLSFLSTLEDFDLGGWGGAVTFLYPCEQPA